MSPYLRRFVNTLLTGSILTLVSGCFTGIESTKKIELSKEDKILTQPSEEDIFISGLQGHPLPEWREGKQFEGLDDRVALIFEQQGLPHDYESLQLGKSVFAFKGLAQVIKPDGTQTVAIVFESDGNTYRYDTKTAAKDLDTFTSTDVPMMVDLDLVRETENKLKGKELWTLTRLWYDVEGEKITGKKFVPVTVTAIESGNSQFPLKVTFSSEGTDACVWMNIGNGGTDSRSFPSLFMLSDPKLRYPKISDEVWRLIQNGDVKSGMTKEECRLSLGFPAKSETGHDYSQTIDLWLYSDGRLLRFIDGVLVSENL